MSDRERWIVYPLLFLAIGLALRNNVDMQDEQGGAADLNQIRCKALEVIGPDGKAKVTLAADDNGDGVVETAAADGSVMVKLGSNPSGADLTLFDADHKKLLLLGFDEQIMGLVAGYVGVNKYLGLATVPIIRPQPQEGKPSPTDKRPNSDAPAGAVKSSGDKSSEEQPPAASEQPSTGSAANSSSPDDGSSNASPATEQK
jgi:hypothetical protein